MIEITNQSSSFREEIPFLLLKLVKFLDGCSFYLHFTWFEAIDGEKRNNLEKDIKIKLKQTLFPKRGKRNVYEVFEMISMSDIPSFVKE